MIDEVEPRRGSKSSIPPAMLRNLSERSQIPDSLKESLKHLGPSNLASAPRQTGLKSIKIKTVGNQSSSDSSQAARGTRIITFQENPNQKGDAAARKLALPSQASHSTPLLSDGEDGIVSPRPEDNATKSSNGDAVVVPEDNVTQVASPALGYKNVRSGNLKEQDGSEGESKANAGQGSNGDDEPNESTSLLGKK